MIKIRYNSKDQTCKDLAELRSVLSRDYIGRHVAVHVTHPNGMVKVYYASVDDLGRVLHTYRGGDFFTHSSEINDKQEVKA